MIVSQYRTILQCFIWCAIWGYQYSFFGKKCVWYHQVHWSQYQYDIQDIRDTHIWYHQVSIPQHAPEVGTGHHQRGRRALPRWPGLCQNRAGMLEQHVVYMFFSTKISGKLTVCSWKWPLILELSWFTQKKYGGFCEREKLPVLGSCRYKMILVNPWVFAWSPWCRRATAWGPFFRVFDWTGTQG